MYNISTNLCFFKDNAELRVYVDGELKVYLAGAVIINGAVSVSMSAHTYRGRVPQLKDVLKPPSGYVYFKNVVYV